MNAVVEVFGTEIKWLVQIQFFFFFSSQGGVHTAQLTLQLPRAPRDRRQKLTV